MQVVKKLIYSWISRRFMGGCSHYNDLATRKGCRSKARARAVFAQNQIPHAKGMVFFSPFKTYKFVKKYGYPVVIKPNVSGFSRGSHFPITSFGQLVKAALLVKIWWPTAIIEEYLAGKNYRVVVVKDQLMSVIRRYPPFVTGDGEATLGELIDRENDIRNEMGLSPVISPIEKSKQLRRYLRRHDMSLAHIPSKGEQVTLFNKISLAPGGVVEIVDKATISEENRALFIKIIELFDANILGIDVIFEQGIETSYTQQKTIFLEVNSRPYLKMHDYPRYGEKEDLSGYYAELERLKIRQGDIF